MNDLISIIVPVYKVEEYLDKCIESIVNQTYTNLEIILVDDGSPDNCPEICDKWAERDNRIKVIHKSNGGLSDARNAGLAVASGEYIAFVDSDDYIEADLYEKLLSTIINTFSDISVCNLRYVYQNDSNSVSQENSDSITEYTAEEAMSALIDDRIRQVVWNKLYKLELIKDIMFDVGKYHEDEFWSYKAIGAANKIATIDYTGYNYLQRFGSIMGNNYSLKRLDAIEAKSLRQKYLKDNFPVLNQKGLINLIFTCVYHGQLSLLYLQESDKIEALNRLNYVIANYIHDIDNSKLSSKQKIWFILLKMSFNLTCKIRNILKIGL